MSDASSLAALSIEVWLGTYIKRGVTAFFADYVLGHFTPENLAVWIADGNERMFVSENTEGIDGYIRITTGVGAPVTGCSDTELTTLYVQPRHHGEGIGRGLLTHARKDCAHRSVPSLWLAVNAENAAALAFYRRLGATRVGQTHFQIQDQAYLNDVLSLPTQDHPMDPAGTAAPTAAPTSDTT
jgi:ribosomal protein S18 acetylase RimI-like enzyme